jgi:outer membrane protein assembly factor BamB
MKCDGITASGVAADGKLYFSAEDGTIFVVKAGAQFEILAKNKMKDVCMATPAISDNTIFFRTQHSVVAVSDVY